MHKRFRGFESLILRHGFRRTESRSSGSFALRTGYALVLTQYTSGETEMFIANKATAMINTAGTDASVLNLAKNWGGTGGPAITGWVKAGGGGDIPEPTSGLLLLVGGAMLALRRRQR